MAANEFEKNVRKEMDDFKFRPSETVWPKIEERIREKNRKRRILFFVLFSLIGLIVGIISDFVYTLVDPRIDFETREV